MPYYGALLRGIEAVRVKILCKAEPGRYTLSMLGGVRGILREAAAIIPQAFQSEGFPLPNCKMTLQLEPQEEVFDRASLELPVALALLLEFFSLPEQPPATQGAGESDSTLADELEIDLIQQIREQREHIAEIQNLQDRNYLLIGALDIFGQVGHVRGLLSMLYDTAKPGDVVIVPSANENEVHLWYQTTPLQRKVDVFLASSLREAYETILGNPSGPPLSVRKFVGFKAKRSTSSTVDFKDIVGQERAKRALEIAAAGGHHCLLYGPTGQGKNLLTEALAGILPPLGDDVGEVQEINRIWSAKRLLPEGDIKRERPFVQVRLGINEPGLLGGCPRRGSDIEPGQISLAHGGVLFMDEINMHPHGLVQMLRGPLQEKKHTVQRARGAVTFPCNFILVGAMNPCDDSFFGEWVCAKCGHVVPQELATCRCGHTELKHRCPTPERCARRFPALLSGPLRNRLHLKVRVYSPEAVLPLTARAEPSSTIQRRVIKARRAQSVRFAGTNRRLNSDIVVPREIVERFDLSPEVRAELGRAPKVLPAQAPMRTKVVSFAVARTIADLGESEQVHIEHLREAVEFTRDLSVDYELRRRGY
jgi:magnesium chelatase family protein